MFGATYFSGCNVSLSDFLELCVKAGLDTVEIQMEYPYSPAELTSNRAKEIVELFASYDLKLLLHASFHDVNLASMKEEIRRASVSIITRCLELAEEMNVKRLVTHCGKCPADQAALVERARERMIASLFELAMLSEEVGVQLGIENKQRGNDIELVMSPEEHLELVNRLKDYGAVAVLDLGHANTTGWDLKEYINGLKSFLAEVHIHDNHGTADDHLPLGEGNLPLTATMRKLHESFDGDIILEIKDVTAIPQSAKQLLVLETP